MKKTKKKRNLVVNVAQNHSEAEEWDIIQQISMTSEERQEAAKTLKKRFFGENVPDVREYHCK